MRIPKCHRTKGFGEGLQNHFPNRFFKIMLIALAQLLEKLVFGTACQSFLSLLDQCAHWSSNDSVILQTPICLFADFRR